MASTPEIILYTLAALAPFALAIPLFRRDSKKRREKWARLAEEIVPTTPVKRKVLQNPELVIRNQLVPNPAPVVKKTMHAPVREKLHTTKPRSVESKRYANQNGDIFPDAVMHPSLDLYSNQIATTSVFEHMPETTVTVETKFEGHGGSFGGAGASDTWGEPEPTRNDSPSDNSYSDASSDTTTNND